MASRQNDGRSRAQDDLLGFLGWARHYLLDGGLSPPAT